MKIHCFTVGPLQTNCYFLVAPKTKSTLIIDPGDAGEYLGEQILIKKLKPVAIILTHAHFDHLLAVPFLQLTFNIPLWLHKGDIPLLRFAGASAAWWLKRPELKKLPPLFPQKTLEDNQQLTLGKESIKILHTPGHTPGSICLFLPQSNKLFTGDLLFAQGVGRTDLPYSNPAQLQSSLKKIKKLAQKTRLTCFPGHGPSFTLP